MQNACCEFTESFPGSPNRWQNLTVPSNTDRDNISAASLACLHAAAAVAQLPLWQHLALWYDRAPTIPLPEIQIFGGGAHAGRRVDVQDFMVMVPGAASFDEALEITAEIYHAAGVIMTRKGFSAGVADEGGWWPTFASNEAALETLCEAIIATGETPGKRVVLSLDIAASEFGGLENTGWRWKIVI